MDQNKLRQTVAIVLIFGHLAIVATAAFEWLNSGYTLDEFLTLVALICPMFALYSTIVVRFLVDNKMGYLQEEKSITISFAMVLLALPILFVGTMLTIVILRGRNIGFSNFEEFKSMFWAIESVFAVYLGALVSNLYRNSARQ